MKVHFINVGYGDSVLIEIPCDIDNSVIRILVDTGSAKEEEYQPEGPRIMVTDYLKQREIDKLDILVLSHPHEDHIAMAIPLMRQLEIGEVWVNHLLPETAECRRIDNSAVSEARFLIDSLNIYTPILAYCRAKGLPVKAMMEKGKDFVLSESFSIRVLNNQTPQGELFGNQLNSLFDKNGNVLISDGRIRKSLITLNRNCNASSLALLFRWKDIKVLLTGDSCPESWPDALFGELDKTDIDLFKLPHHGQRDSINERAIKAVSPRFIVTSGASDRRNDSSNPDCYRLIEEHMGNKPVLLFTDEVRYEPYFEVPGPFRALILTLAPGQQSSVEFDLCPEPETANDRAEVLL